MEENVDLTNVSSDSSNQIVTDDQGSNDNVVNHENEVQQEKMIPQSQVNKIAAREARQAAEKAEARTRESMLKEFEARQTQSNMATPPVSQELGGMNSGLSDEDLDNRIMQAAHRLSLQAKGHEIASQYEGKINAIKDEDPEFARAYDDSGIGNNPLIVMWTNELDNTGSVIKEMVNNPEKFAQVMMLAGTGAHGMARNALQRLSSSIKTNEAALKQPKVKEPLSQIRPTNIGMADNESLTVSDFSKQPWLRG